MASYTSNLNLKKPALTDDALVTDLNDNSDKLDAAISAGSGAIAIVSVGNTHAAISSGQYVYVRQHGSLSEGLYKATTNIAANGTLSGSNLTAVSGGGLNSVYSALSNHLAYYVPGDVLTIPYVAYYAPCNGSGNACVFSYPLHKPVKSGATVSFSQVSIVSPKKLNGSAFTYTDVSASLATNRNAINVTVSGIAGGTGAYETITAYCKATMTVS